MQREDWFDKLDPKTAADVRKNLRPKTAQTFSIVAWLEGYEAAVKDFGIWKDGVQTIGCLNTPVNEVIARVRAEAAEFLK